MAFSNTNKVSADTPANDTPSISLTTVNNTASLPISAMNGNGTFATTEEADSASFNITTTNLAGYTLLISSNNDSGKLILGTNADAPYFSSIDTITATSTYSSSTSTNYNNTWGIKPSKYVEGGNSISSVVDNTGSDPVFLPSPTTSPITLDITNTTNTTPNNYTLGLGARADFTTTPGSYKTTIDLILVANPAGLIITYNKNTEDSIPVSNMPSPQAETGDSNTSTTITLSNNIPERAHYTFAGWCDTAPDVASCPTGATMVQPGGTYTLAQVDTTVKKVLYAVWTPNYYMQDVQSWGDNLSINESVQAIDRRDNKIYWVTKLETDPENPRALIDEKTGKSYQIWMTQNLDYDLVAGTTLTHTDTDLGWGTGNSNATWTVQNSTFTNIADWQNNSDGTGKCLDEECSYTNGDRYYYIHGSNDADTTIYNSMDACKAAGYTADECVHYSGGNYYNFRTAAAQNADDNIGINSGVQYTYMPNSICPAGWRLFAGSNGDGYYSDTDYLFYGNNITTAHGNTNLSYSTDGFNKIRSAPFWFIQAGNTYNGGSPSPTASPRGGYYWSSTGRWTTQGSYMDISPNRIDPSNGAQRVYGFTIRCIARADSMQDAASWSGDMNINESKQVADIRDNKVYWVTKLETDPANPRAEIDTKTGKSYQIWMTQNLDLSFSGNQTYTHYNTDLGYTTNETDIVWMPDATMTDIANWDNGANGTGACLNLDCSYENGAKYIFTSNSTANDTTYNSLQDCVNAGHSWVDCGHSYMGNFYNFHAATALGATKNGVAITQSTDKYTYMQNSTCPAGWRLPVGNTSLGEVSQTPPADNSNWSDFGYLLKQNNVIPHTPLPDSGIASTSTSPYGNDARNVGYANDGLNKLRSSPFYFVRSGRAWDAQLINQGSVARYWSGSSFSNIAGFYLAAFTTDIYPSSSNYRVGGLAVRCILR